MVKGKPESEELIPLAALEASVGKAAYAYYAVFAVMLSSACKSLLAVARPFRFSA